MVTRRTASSVLSPPPIPTISRNLPTIEDIRSYLSNDLFNYLTNFYKHAYLMWERTGAYEISEFNLAEVKISAQEANTLIGIDTSKTVQTQLNEKAGSADLGTMAFQNSDNVAVTGGFIAATAMNNVTVNNSLYIGGTVQDAVILAKAGSSSDSMQIGGVLVSNVISVGNIGTGEDNLIQYTVNANTLDIGNCFLEISAFGTFAGNANNKRVKLYFGSAVLIDTGLVPANDGSWSVKSTVIRVNSNAQKNISSIISNNTSISDGTSYIASSEDLTASIIVKCTGQGITDNDVVQEGLIIKMFNG